MIDEKFECISRDGSMLGVDTCAARIPLGSSTPPVQVVRIAMLPGPGRIFDVGETFFADPAAADRIASALHVAAAQVRSARGEKLPPSDIVVVDYPGTVGEFVLVSQRYDKTSSALVSRADVPRLIAELGAWLAAHPEVAK